ncbi:MAG TPA: hypothetical protein VNH19_11675 [Candidatus Limnocylindrales bacterium]|nr:hypothetical protein [Candidatus Limnocylindrales bacterium]
MRRAEWKLQTGKPAEALSANYRLDCDYGTAVITCWEKGGIEPIYVCESHAKQLGPSRGYSPEARVLTAESENKESTIKREDRIKTEELSGTKPKGASSPEAAQSASDQKVGRGASDGPARTRSRDLTFGNPAKAMVDEAIWNLATGDYEAYRAALQQGKSASEAAQAAGGQLAVIHQKISDYALKMEGVLSEAKATISAGETIDKPLEQAMLEIIGSDGRSDLDKDAAIQQLGAMQEWIKQGAQGEMTALQANQMLLRIGEQLNWGGSCEVSEELKAVYRAVHSNLKAAICTAAPRAQNFLDRLSNLYAAKSELDRELVSAKELTQAVR